MNVIEETLSSFSSREIVILIYLIIVFIVTLLKDELRKDYRSILRSVLKPVILIVATLQIVYICLTTFLLIEIGVWQTLYLKDTILWALTSFVLVGTQLNEITGFSSIRKIVLQQLKVIVILEFLVQLFPFNIWIELILQPALFFLGAMVAVSSYKSDLKTKKASSFFKTLVGVIGIMFVTRGLYLFFDNYQDFASIENVKLLPLPFVYTILFTPFLYFLSIYNLYDQLIGKFGRLRLVLKNIQSPYIKYLHRKSLLEYNFWLPFWSRFNGEYANEIILSGKELDKEKIDLILKKAKD